MIPLVKDFDTQDLLALLVVGAFVVATFTLSQDSLLGIKDMALLVVGFYFGKFANPAPAAISQSTNYEPPAIVSMPCPYIEALNDPMNGIETLGEDLTNGK